MRRSPRTRLLAASVATLATIAFAACGDDDDDTASTDSADVTLSTDAGETTAPDDTAVSVSEPAETTVEDTAAPDDTSEGTTPSSGSGEVGSQDEYVEAAKGEVAFEDEDMTDCVATAIVNDDIYAAIQESGLTIEAFQEDGPADLGLDEAAASQVAEDFAACGDLLPQVLTDEAELACAEEHLSNDQMAEYLAFTLLGIEPSAELQAANDAVETCITDAAGTTTT